MKTFSVFDVEAAMTLLAPLPTETVDLLHAMREAEDDLEAEVYINVLDDGKFRADAIFDSAGQSSNDCDTPAAALLSLYHGYSNMLPPANLRNMAQEVTR